MMIATTIEQVRSFVADQRKQGNTIGFVPTMGALHAGHLSLVDASKRRNTTCIMSIFVNPTQFGPSEDYMRYPRPIEKDKELARGAGVDLLFIPSVETMYPSAEKTVFVEELRMSSVMCGKYRPGHFRGVCTVVNKLLNITTPDELFLGEKDAQQFRILKKMALELQMPVGVIGVPIMREKNGLAMSSRNQYLTAEHRETAAIIYRALSTAREKFESGERNAKKIIQAAHAVLETVPAIRLQYLEVRNWDDFDEPVEISKECLLAIACYLGDIRLIDNVMLSSNAR